METYQIEATVEKFELNNENGNLKINIKGATKYCFEDSKKIYWNIFENCNGSNETDKPVKHIFHGQEEPVQIIVSENKTDAQHLLYHAFIEKKKLKFTLIGEGESFTITGISNAPN